MLHLGFERAGACNEIFRGKSTQITGAGQGIERGIALWFAKEGASVDILDVNTIDCLHVESDIARSGGRAMASLSDVALSSAMH